MLTDLATKAAAIGADIATVGGALVGLALAGLAITAVVSKIRGK